MLNAALIVLRTSTVTAVTLRLNDLLHQR
jgi:hypothetical protein